MQKIKIYELEKQASKHQEEVEEVRNQSKVEAESILEKLSHELKITIQNKNDAITQKINIENDLCTITEQLSDISSSMDKNSEIYSSQRFKDFLNPKGSKQIIKSKSCEKELKLTPTELMEQRNIHSSSPEFVSSLQGFGLESNVKIIQTQISNLQELLVLKEEDIQQLKIHLENAIIMNDEKVNEIQGLEEATKEKELTLFKVFEAVKNIDGQLGTQGYKEGETIIHLGDLLEKLNGFGETQKIVSEEYSGILAQYEDQRQKLLEENQKLGLLADSRISEISKKVCDRGSLMIKLALAYAELERISGFNNKI